MSLERLHEHRRLWAAKPVLARVYEPWFDGAPRRGGAPARASSRWARARASCRSRARERRPDLRWIASDLHAAPWNTLAADAGRLPLARRRASTRWSGLDVLHHLARPADFFREAARVLRRRRAARARRALDHAASPGRSTASSTRRTAASSVDPWQPVPGGGKDSFEGDAAVPWRIARDTPAGAGASSASRRRACARLNAFAYLLSLGFRPGLAAAAPLAAPALIALDRATSPLAPLTALRAVLTWRTA